MVNTSDSLDKGPKQIMSLCYSPHKRKTKCTLIQQFLDDSPRFQ